MTANTEPCKTVFSEEEQLERRAVAATLLAGRYAAGPDKYAVDELAIEVCLELADQLIAKTRNP